ncbi:MAG TPA: hypothetical protein VIY68_15265 [Steroidobacteraceae bacterium]
MASRRQTRTLLTLATVLGAHLVVLWLLMSSHQFSMKARSEILQLVWVPQRPQSDLPLEPRATIQGPSKTVPRHRIDRMPDSPSIAPLPKEVDSATHPTPDWSQELQLAAKNAVAKELERKKHEADFTHVFPTQPKKPPQFAWNYAATHRIEALPQGGLVIHINDNCALLIFPLPFIGCSIGKRPANGDLFEHLHD